jgi:hypothetical protein
MHLSVVAYAILAAGFIGVATAIVLQVGWWYMLGSILAGSSAFKLIDGYGNAYREKAQSFEQYQKDTEHHEARVADRANDLYKSFERREETAEFLKRKKEDDDRKRAAQEEYAKRETEREARQEMVKQMAEDAVAKAKIKLAEWGVKWNSICVVEKRLHAELFADTIKYPLDTIRNSLTRETGMLSFPVRIRFCSHGHKLEDVRVDLKECPVCSAPTATIPQPEITVSPPITPSAATLKDAVAPVPIPTAPVGPTAPTALDDQPQPITPVIGASTRDRINAAIEDAAKEASGQLNQQDGHTAQPETTQDGTLETINDSNNGNDGEDGQISPHSEPSATSDGAGASELDGHGNHDAATAAAKPDGFKQRSVMDDLLSRPSARDARNDGKANGPNVDNDGQEFEVGMAVKGVGRWEGWKGRVTNYNKHKGKVKIQPVDHRTAPITIPASQLDLCSDAELEEDEKILRDEEKATIEMSDNGKEGKRN